MVPCSFHVEINFMSIFKCVCEILAPWTKSFENQLASVKFNREKKVSNNLIM